MYEPNQYVMNCGVVDPTAGPIRFYTPLARNLNNGDSIVLVVRHTRGQHGHPRHLSLCNHSFNKFTIAVIEISVGI